MYRKIFECKRAASERIYQFYPQHKQVNAALGVGFTAEETQQMVDFINAVRARCDEYEAAIEQGQDPVIDYSDITP